MFSTMLCVTPQRTAASMSKHARLKVTRLKEPSVKKEFMEKVHTELRKVYDDAGRGYKRIASGVFEEHTEEINSSKDTIHIYTDGSYDKEKPSSARDTSSKTPKFLKAAPLPPNPEGKSEEKGGEAGKRTTKRNHPAHETRLPKQSKFCRLRLCHRFLFCLRRLMFRRCRCQVVQELGSTAEPRALETKPGKSQDGAAQGSGRVRNRFNICHTWIPKMEPRWAPEG